MKNKNYHIIVEKGAEKISFKGDEINTLVKFVDVIIYMCCDSDEEFEITISVDKQTFVIHNIDDWDNIWNEFFS